MMIKELSKIFAGLATVAIVEKIAEGWDRSAHYQQADVLESQQKKLWQDKGYTPSMSEQQTLLNRADEIRYRQPHGMADQLWNLFKKLGRDQ